MRFSPIRAFVAALAGKFLMCLILAYAGRTSFKIVLAAYGGNSLIGVAATVVVLAVVIYFMMRTDWEKLAEKYGPDIVKKAEDVRNRAT
jgi:hypothetical protein